jgi:heme/copper-type cytochrome/quinol oxidase subunit 2
MAISTHALRFTYYLKRSSRAVWPFLALVAVSLAFVPIPAPTAAPAEHRLRVEASSFAFAPAVLSVNPGDRVTIELVSTDVVHGLYLDGYGLSVSADPGQTAYLSFIAERPGTFRFRCSVTCGALHPFMIGKLKVGYDDLLWRGAGLSLLAVLFGFYWSRRK